MPKAKVKLGLIPSESARRSSFKKRRQGVVKKVKELSKLCDVNACIIIYGRDSNEPIVWPNRRKAEELVRKYLSLPGYVRCKKTLSQESFLREQVAKMQIKHDKTLRSNTVKDMDDLMRQNGKPIYELDINQTYGLLKFLEEKMKEILNQTGFFQQAGGSSVTTGGPVYTVGDPSYTTVHSEPTINLGVLQEIGMTKFPFGTFGLGGGSGSDNDSGIEMGLHMRPQCYENNIKGGGNGNLLPNMLPYNGNIASFGGGNGGLPVLNHVGNDLTGNGSQMSYFMMLPQYYESNVMTSNGSI